MKADLPPTQSDWGVMPKDDLDVQAAYKDFFGKTNQEMQSIFSRIVAIEWADSLRWMPTIPFRYYMLGFTDHIMHLKAGDLEASDAANSFLNLVEEQLRNNSKKIMPIMDVIIPAVDYLARNQKAFSASINIYGDFNEKKKKILELWDISRPTSK